MAATEQRRKFLIGVKVSESERQEIDRVAQSEAISRSAVVRRAVLRELRRNKSKDGADR